MSPERIGNPVAFRRKCRAAGGDGLPSLAKLGRSRAYTMSFPAASVDLSSTARSSRRLPARMVDQTRNVDGSRRALEWSIVAQDLLCKRG